MANANTVRVLCAFLVSFVVKMKIKKGDPLKRTTLKTFQDVSVKDYPSPPSR